MGERLRVGVLSKLGAEVAGRGLQFVLIYATQRVLGPAMYGHYTVATSAGLVLVPLVDFGGQLTIARRLASGEAADPARLVGGALLERSLATLALALPLVGLAATRPTGLAGATFGLALAVLVGTFVELFGSVFRGLQRTEFDAALLIAARGLTTSLGLGALAYGGGLPLLAAAHLTAAVASALMGYRLLCGRFFRPAWRVGLVEIRGLLRDGAPLGAALLLSMAYTRTAVFFLDAFEGPLAVGAYGVAQKLTEPLAILPAALLAPLYPAFAEAVASRSGSGAASLRRLALGWLLGCGAAVAVAGVVVGPWIVGWLYGAPYAAAARPLQVLAVATIPMFLNYALTHFLIAAGGERRFLAFTATLFIVNAMLCVAWIPRWGPTGAAWAALAAECTLLVLCALAGRPAAMGTPAQLPPRVPPYD